MDAHKPGQTGCDDRLLQSSPAPTVQAQTLDRHHRNPVDENYDVRNLPGQLQEEHHHVKVDGDPCNQSHSTSVVPQLAPAPFDHSAPPATAQASQAITPFIGDVSGAKPHPMSPLPLQ